MVRQYGSGDDDDDSIADENSLAVEMAQFLSVDELDVIADPNMFIDNGLFNQTIFPIQNSSLMGSPSWVGGI